ncbi:enzymatic polyprotein [Labeo rohita]|uniref:ribonuclease H n=1 Tax=Labeo rohita TaxID=84645 RepID=A0ABQ8L5A8_LABRO|nr:enzymatic polyprotein [Labeo rohita]
MKEKDRVYLLDAPLAASGLFGNAINSVIDRYQGARKQPAAFQRFLLRCVLAIGAAGQEYQLLMQGVSKAERASQKRSKSGASKSKPDLRVVLQAKKSSMKRSCTNIRTGQPIPRCPSLLRVPSGDHYAYPAGVPGCSGLRRAHTSVSSGNVAELGSSPPLRGSLEQLVRSVPAGAPLQGTELAVQTNPETGLERLVPLVDYLAARVFPTLVGPEQGLVMEQEVETLLRKEAIEVSLLKTGSPGSTADLRLLNHSVMRLKFRMLTVNQVVSQVRSEDWFVMIDLKDAYFHVSIFPQHRKFRRFAFRGEAYQYQVLPFGLALSPHTFTKCVDAALAPLQLRGICILNYIDDWLILVQSEHMAVQHRDHLAYMKELGLRLNAKKSVLSPLQRTTYLGVVWNLTTMQARLSPARIESILTAVARVKEGIHCKAVPTTAGSHGSCVQHHTFWPAVHETPRVVAQDQGVLPEGKPVSHD